MTSSRNWEEYIKVQDIEVIAGVVGELIFHDGSAIFRTYDGARKGLKDTSARFHGVDYHIHVTVEESPEGIFHPKWKYENSYKGAFNADIHMYRKDDNMKNPTDAAREWVFNTIIPAVTEAVIMHHTQRIQAKIRESRMQIKESENKIKELEDLLITHKEAILRNEERIDQLAGQLTFKEREGLMYGN